MLELTTGHGKFLYSAVLTEHHCTVEIRKQRYFSLCNYILMTKLNLSKFYSPLNIYKVKLLSCHFTGLMPYCLIWQFLLET